MRISTRLKLARA